MRNDNEGSVPSAAVEKLVYTLAETSAALGGLSRTTLWRLEQTGALRPLHGIRHKMYAVREILRYVDKQTKAGA